MLSMIRVLFMICLRSFRRIGINQAEVERQHGCGEVFGPFTVCPAVTVSVQLKYTHCRIGCLARPRLAQGDV